MSHPEREPIWHDIECGRYDADLELWRELTEPGQRVLDLGAGTGRVALDLARHGREVWGLDNDPSLMTELERRAATAGLPVTAVTADAREFDLGRRFDVVLAPMQFLQLLGHTAGRMQCLRTCAAHLEPDGLFATAVLDLSGEPIDSEYEPPAPDVGERDGWTYSSLPVGIRTLDRGREIALDRVRTATSPDGIEDHENNSVCLRLVGSERLSLEMKRSGITPTELRHIGPTDDHVGSAIVIGRLAP